MTKTNGPISSDDLRRQAHFLEEVELAVRASNREIIGAALPHLGREEFYRLAVAVARLRADYLAAVTHLDWHQPRDTDLENVQRQRLKYEEAKAGFEAIRHAIELGYLQISEATSAGGKL